MANSSYHPTRKAGRGRRRGLAAMRGRVMVGRPSPATCPLSTTWFDTEGDKKTRGPRGQEDHRSRGGSISGDYLGICWNRWGKKARQGERARGRSSTRAWVVGWRVDRVDVMTEREVKREA